MFKKISTMETSFLLVVVLEIASVNCFPRPYPLTQEQLAQYVAAQQTQQPAAPRYVTSAVPIPRHRLHAYQQQESGQDDGASSEQQQAAYQLQSEEAPGSAEIAARYRQPAQQPLVYYRPQPQQPVQRKYKARPSQLRLLSPSAGVPQEQDQQQPDYDPNPQYQFSFDIKDDESTNYHNRKETRDGDKISGSYSVVDSDGYIRTVTYTADPLEGFKADVSREPTDIVVKLPKHPTPTAGIAQQYQQISPAQALLARKQVTQQYLQASSPVESDEQQYTAVKAQPVPVYSAARAAALAGTPPAAAAYYTHRLSGLPAPKAPKAYVPEQHNPLVYRTYQQ